MVGNRGFEPLTSSTSMKRFEEGGKLSEMCRNAAGTQGSFPKCAETPLAPREAF